MYGYILVLLGLLNGYLAFYNVDKVPAHIYPALLNMFACGWCLCIGSLRIADDNYFKN